MGQNLPGKLVSEIDGVKNIWLGEQNEIESLYDQIPLITDINLTFLSDIEKILDRNNGRITMHQLEKFLIYNYGKDIKYLDQKSLLRYANCFAWKNTQLHRDSNNIVLPKGQTEMVTESNIGNKIIDPIGWASKPMAPSGGFNHGTPSGYGILGKIPQLRPMSGEGVFDKKIYGELMNTRVLISFLGISIEQSDEEIAIIPTFKLIGGEDIIENYSEEKDSSDIPTAKWYGINSKT